MATATQQLGRFARELRLSDVPAEALAKVKEHVLDTVGVTLFGAAVPVIQPVRSYIERFGAPGTSRLVGPRSSRFDAEYAAMFNATSAMATELDDHHTSSGHPCSVVSGVLAVGEELSSSGAECLLAIIAGYEITSRVGMATTVSIVIDRAFVNSSIYNGFGVAAGSGLLMDLSVEELANALSIAGSHSSGVNANVPTPMGRLHAGVPAASGIRSARLAKFGFLASPILFEAEKGYLAAFSAHPEPEQLTKDLGKELLGVMGLRLKHTYSSAGNIHPQIEALQQILRASSIDHSEIEEIRVGMDPMMLLTTRFVPNVEEVKNTPAAHFSTPLQLAITAVRGRNDFQTLLDLERKGFDDPEIMQFAKRVSVELDPECAALFPKKWMTKVTVITKDGRSFQERAFALGEPDAEEKFRSILDAVVPTAQIEAIIDRVSSLEELQNIEELTELLEIPASS